MIPARRPPGQREAEAATRSRAARQTARVFTRRSQPPWDRPFRLSERSSQAPNAASPLHLPILIPLDAPDHGVYGLLVLPLLPYPIILWSVIPFLEWILVNLVKKGGPPRQ